jgi:hypothetical protein
MYPQEAQPRNPRIAKGRVGWRSSAPTPRHGGFHQFPIELPDAGRLPHRVAPASGLCRLPSAAEGLASSAALSRLARSPPCLAQAPGAAGLRSLPPDFAFGRSTPSTDRDVEQTAPGRPTGGELSSHSRGGRIGPGESWLGLEGLARGGGSAKITLRQDDRASTQAAPGSGPTVKTANHLSWGEWMQGGQEAGGQTSDRSQ